MDQGEDVTDKSWSSSVGKAPTPTLPACRFCGMIGKVTKVYLYEIAHIYLYEKTQEGQQSRNILANEFKDYL